MSRQWLVVVLLAMTMGACSKQDEAPASSDTAGEPRHPWKDQVKALHKAEQVEQELMDAFKRRDEEMERQSQ